MDHASARPDRQVRVRLDEVQDVPRLGLVDGELEKSGSPQERPSLAAQGLVVRRIRRRRHKEPRPPERARHEPYAVERDASRDVSVAHRSRDEPSGFLGDPASQLAAGFSSILSRPGRYGNPR